jgi:GTP:adenosylcobinamide-phosphate guanylyltransferase
VTDVLIMAGTASPSTLTEEEGVKNKAFIKIHGKDMFAYVLQAFRTAKGIGRIAVVAPAAEMRARAEEDILIVPEGDSLVDNLKKGCLALEPGEHFLVCSSDVPFLTAEAVEDFLAACHPYDYDFYYPIVSRADNERRFPGVKRTYVKIKNAEYTGGNLFLVNPRCLPAALPRLEKFYALRKNPLRLAGTLGLFFVLKLLLKKVTIRELEERFAALFAIKGKAVISAYPEIGTDIDKPSDLALARQLLKPAG